MDLKLKLLFLVGWLAAPAALAVEPASVDRARAELDQQLQALVDASPPPEVQLSFEGLALPDYKLAEVHFTLDGEPLAVPSVDALSAPGPHVLASKQVPEGTHTLVSNVVYMDASWSLFSETSGFLWNLTSTVTFQVQRGLRVRVKALPAFVPEAKDPRLRIKLSHDMAVEMTAKLDDGPLPEPVSQKAEPPPDAGTPLARQEPKPPEPKPPTVAAAPKALLRVRATVRRKGVPATVHIRGATTQQVALKRGKAASKVELAPGEYTVEVLAAGYLAQTRRVKLAEGEGPELEFALVRAPRKKLVKQDGDRLELLKPLRFPEGSAVLMPGSGDVLQQIVDLVVRGKPGRLRIEGHTDSREGEEGARQQLSEVRARAVAEQLVQAGLDPARIETVGFGDTRSKAPNLTPRGRELNRRVEFVLLAP